MSSLKSTPDGPAPKILITGGSPADRLFWKERLENISGLQCLESAHEPDRTADMTCRESLREFCHIAAHDLKAPARRIAQFCEILKEEAGPALNAECRDYIDRMNVNAARLQNLVGDIRSYALALSPAEEKQRIDMNDVLKNVLDDLHPAIIRNNATIHADTLPQINAYPEAMAEIFKNILDNALKYRGQEDPVISLHCTEDATHFIFTVEDNGAGIEEKFHARIFKPFERLQSQDAVEGSGLGLATCQKLAELHHGKIWLVRSQPGAGSVFKFSIEK